MDERDDRLTDREYAGLIGPGAYYPILGDVYPGFRVARVVEEPDGRVRVAADLPGPRLWPRLLGVPVVAILFVALGFRAGLDNLPETVIWFFLGFAGLIFTTVAVVGTAWQKLIARVQRGPDRLVVDPAAGVVEVPYQQERFPLANVLRLEFLIGRIVTHNGPSKSTYGEWHLVLRDGDNERRVVLVREQPAGSFRGLPHAAEAERVAALVPFPAYAVVEKPSLHWSSGDRILGGGVAVKRLN